MKSFVKRVDARMKELGLNQLKLASKAGRTQSDISKLLNGKLKRVPSWVYDLSKALETSVKWLETGVEDSAPHTAPLNEATIGIGQAVDMVERMTEEDRLKLSMYLNAQFAPATSTTTASRAQQKRGQKSRVKITCGNVVKCDFDGLKITAVKRGLGHVVPFIRRERARES